MKNNKIQKKKQQFHMKTTEVRNHLIGRVRVSERPNSVPLMLDFISNT